VLWGLVQRCSERVQRCVVGDGWRDVKLYKTYFHENTKFTEYDHDLVCCND